MTELWGTLSTLNGYDADVRINDVVVASATVAMGLEQSAHVSEWIVNGRNHLTLTVHRALAYPDRSHPPLDGALVRVPQAPPCARVHLFSGHREKLVKPGEDPAVASLEWLPPTGDREWRFPQSMSATFDVAERPRFTWMQGEPFDLDDARARESLVSEVATIEADLRNRSTASLARLMQGSLPDSRWVGITPEEYMRMLDGVFGTMFLEETFSVAPVDFGAMKLRTFAAGRVVDVLNERGEPLLHSLPGEEPSWALELRLVRISGHWLRVGYL